MLIFGVILRKAGQENGQGGKHPAGWNGIVPVFLRTRDV